MPVALLAMVTTSIVVESGITLGLWNVRETAYPLNHTLSYVYGMAPVVAMWLFKFAFKRFWLYLTTDAVFNLGFAFLLTPWLAGRGIKDLFASKFSVFLIVTALSILLYMYQIWQENAWADSRVPFYELQPARKRLPREDESD